LRNTILFGMLVLIIVIIWIPSILVVQSATLVNGDNVLQGKPCIIGSKVNNSNILFIGRISGIGITTSSYLCLYGIYDGCSELHLNISTSGISILYIESKKIGLEKPCRISLYNFSGIGTPMHPLWINIKNLIPPVNVTTWILLGRCQDYQITK